MWNWPIITTHYLCFSVLICQSFIEYIQYNTFYFLFWLLFSVLLLSLSILIRRYFPAINWALISRLLSCFFSAIPFYQTPLYAPQWCLRELTCLSICLLVMSAVRLNIKFSRLRWKLQDIHSIFVNVSMDQGWTLLLLLMTNCLWEWYH